MTAFLMFIIALATPSPVLSAGLVPIAEAPEISLQERANLIAEELDFSTTTLANVIDAETAWDCTLVGKDGELGCLQIIPKFHPDVDPLDFDASVRYFISESKAGRGWQWVSMNCYAYVSLFVDLPKMKDIVPNVPASKGAVAVFQYKQKHIALVTEIRGDGFYVKEANYEAGKIGKRFVRWDDVRLVGFYK